MPKNPVQKTYSKTTKKMEKFRKSENLKNGKLTTRLLKFFKKRRKSEKM
ncbi:hypothetical protein JT321_gp45 [Providencia phage Kokobel1]|uniref:Uncharacterized protein n=1 Tax=Providencia phage Kokobel1 TaxID=2783540 RepID=A0A873WG44_9CAUD|nr:hypothetical protein JT321_gp45 [Providencia phage Kokobel1]QPB11472.1 hypothetical protein [Providencia phage Kokobel1]